MRLMIRFAFIISAVIAAGGAFSQGITYDSFLALQEEKQDLTWVMLDCVQGIYPDEISVACNSAIERYDGVAAAGDQLLSQGAFSQDQEKEILRLRGVALSMSVILRSVRAKMVQDEDPLQAAADCEKAREIAQRVEDASLAQLVAVCPERQ